MTIIYFTAGSDFEEVSADLMFDQFTDQVCTNVTIFGDDLYEGDERFTLNLTTSEPFVNLSPDSSVVEIIDQDGVFHLQFINNNNCSH